MALLLSATSRKAEAQILMVGSNSSGQTTNFTSGTNTFTYAYIGATATDSNNTLNVFNTNTRLTITGGNIQVGYGGNNNSMVISNGGFVSDVTGVVSFGTGSNNYALVTGAGSTWSNSTQVRLGVSGQGTLTVANGGSVIVTGANGIQVAVNAGSVGVLNIGSYGGNDSAGLIIAPKIAFGSGTGTLNFNQTNTFTLTNAITGGNTIVFQQLGSGTTILTGANSSANSTLISQGTLQIGDGGANGSIGNGAITNNSVLAINSSTNITFASGNGIRGTGALIQMGTGTTTLNASNTTYSGGTLISGGTLQVGAGPTGSSGDTNGSLGTGKVTNNATLAFSRRFASDTVSNNISGTGALTVLGSSGGLILAGSNSYSGLTTITTNNTLQIGIGGTNGTLGSGSVSNAGTLTFNRSDLYTVTNTISGSGALSQIGSGTTILSGSNSYTGGTTVTNGMLQIGNGGTSGSVGGGGITLSGAGLLAFNRADSVTLTNYIGGGGGVLSQMGAGTLVIKATGATYGGTVISNGTLQLGDGGANGAIGSGAITNNSVLAVNSSTNFTFASGNGIRGTGALIQMGTGTTILNASNTTYSGGTLISGGTLQVGNGATYDTNGSLGTGNVTNNATLAFKRYLQTDTVSNNISGTGALTVSGSSTALTLAGSNSYSGLTTITTNNTLQIGIGGTNGTLGSGSVSNAGTLTFNRSDLYTVTNTISGSGALSQIGSGTTILSGSNSYTGVTTITNGTLLANNTTGSAVGTNTVNVSSGGSLGGNGTIGGRTYITSSSLIPGSGGLSGSGTLTFTKGLTLQSGATTSFLINATNNFTSINLSGGSLTYGGTLSFNLTSYAPVAVAGNIFTLFNLTNGATETGNFTSLSAIGDTISFTNNAGVWTGSDTYGSTYQFSVATGQLSVASTVPEPSTYALFGLGALALIIACRARSRRVA
jgi:autotransporter-associated beta strand protein